MLTLLLHASWELNRRWCAAWHSLMTMVIFTMHQNHDLAPSHGRGGRIANEGLGTARCRDGTWQEGKGRPSSPHGWRASSYGLSIMPLMVVKVKVLVCKYPFLLLQDLSPRAPKATVYTFGWVRTGPTVHIDAAEHRTGSANYVRRWDHPGMLADGPGRRPSTRHPYGSRGSGPQ